jgi:predicted dehydrogenase
LVLKNSSGKSKQVYFENPTIAPNNAILDELETFADAINQNTTPIVSLSDGTEALKVAYRIIEAFKN